MRTVDLSWMIMSWHFSLTWVHIRSPLLCFIFNISEKREKFLTPQHTDKHGLIRSCRIKMQHKHLWTINFHVLFTHWQKKWIWSLRMANQRKRKLLSVAVLHTVPFTPLNFSTFVTAWKWYRLNWDVML